jgi:alpha-D-ribose 1-methylphosphonate 5-triphosphate synthase subunit PhnL
LKSLDFLSKFMRLNPNILDIDIGENPLSDKEMQKFTKNV